MSTTINAGRIAPLPKGTYNASTTYAKLDIVDYQGSSYIAKQETTGNAPTNTTYWQLMSAGGHGGGAGIIMGKIDGLDFYRVESYSPLGVPTFSNTAETGDENSLYVDILTNKAYRWEKGTVLIGESRYKELDSEEIKTVNGLSLTGSGDIKTQMPVVFAFDDGNWTCDWSFEDLNDAYNAGVSLFGVIEGNGNYNFGWVVESRDTFMRFLWLGADEANTSPYTIHDYNIFVLEVQDVTVDDVTTTEVYQRFNKAIVTTDYLSDYVTTTDLANYTTKTDLADYAPVLDDTRTSATSIITAEAPFETLEPNQRIIIKLAFNVVSNAKIQLTLSGGGTTVAKELWGCTKVDSHQLSSGTFRTGSLMECIYNAYDDKWWVIGMLDSDTLESPVTTAELQAGTSVITKAVTAKVLHDNFYTTVVEVSGATPTQELAPNTFYKFTGNPTALTLTLGTAISGITNIYAFSFVAGAANPTIGLPASVTIDGTPSIASGDYVEFSIQNNVALFKVVSL